MLEFEKHHMQKVDPPILDIVVQQLQFPWHMQTDGWSCMCCLLCLKGPGIRKSWHALHANMTALLRFVLCVLLGLDPKADTCSHNQLTRWHAEQLHSAAQSILTIRKIDVQVAASGVFPVRLLHWLQGLVTELIPLPHTSFACKPRRLQSKDVLHRVQKPRHSVNVKTPWSGYGRHWPGYSWQWSGYSRHWSGYSCYWSGYGKHIWKLELSTTSQP